MAYLDSFIESMMFHMEFNDEYKKSNPDFEQLKSTLTTLWDKREEEYYQNMLEVLKTMSGAFCKTFQKII